MMIFAMFAFAGHVFADANQPVKPIGPGSNLAKPIVVNDDDANPSGDSHPAAASSAFVAPPANDTCAGAVALTLGITTKGTTVGANDDYQSPATAACFPGDGQYLTNAPGRDVVYSFTAPADGSYTFRIIQQSPNDVIRTQNTVLYLTDCANAGTVNCAVGANRGQSAAFAGANGATNNQSEEIACYPMTSGQTTYVVFDDGAPGACINNFRNNINVNHSCWSDSDCKYGGTCNPALNVGGTMSLEAINCASEVEPNNGPSTATPYVCGIVGSTAVAPVAHCYLGTRAGAVCTRSSFLEQSLPNSNMRCSISGNPCVVDLPTGVGDCASGEGICQQQTDLDCDPRCDSGPNAGKTCGTQGFCNPVSDQGATCAGTCQSESTCIVTATGVDTGVACTPVCVGSSIASVNGRYCSALSGCPGGGVCTVTALAPQPGAICVTGQTCGRQFNEGDADFFSIGAPPSGSKVFVGLDAKAANDYDWRMRVTTATNTLQFDDDDVTSRGGTNAPAIAGAVTDGSQTYIQVSRTSARTGGVYEVFAIVRGAPATAQLEDESGPFGNDIFYYWPGNVIAANYATSGGYVRGSFAFQGDSDCFKFLVNKGDLMDWFGDGGPGRNTNPVSSVNIAQPIIYDAEPAGISNFIFGANPRKNTLANVQGPGLKALSPAVTSSYFQWRASYTGMVEVCFYDASQALSQGTPAHPSAWVGSLSVNCGPLQPAGPGATTADVSITKTGPAGPVQTGQFVDYTITVTNNGTEIAQEVVLFDTLDANLGFVSLVIDDGFGGNNTACFSLPSQGTADAPIDCNNTSMAPGATTTYTLTVQVNNCIGAGIDIVNTASITSVSTDPDTSNNEASATITTSEDGTCTDIVCDGDTCFENRCTTNDHCEAGVCKTLPLDGFACSGDPYTRCSGLDDPACAGAGFGTCVEVNGCDDASVCTDDSCSPAVGCIRDSSQAGDLCDDFNACTQNACDAVTFCVYPPETLGTTCDDGLACTNQNSTDACDGNGSCTGVSICDDGNGCTDDFADEANACFCSYAPSVGGTSCSDNNACTGTVAAGDSCDGAGVCTGGQAVECDDSDACTADSCDPGVGCVNAAITCDDGNACNGVESCDTATGCVGGVPVVCTASDQCHVAGTCDSGTGLCSNPDAPNGTTCDDGNAGTSGDSCQGGSCVGQACTSTNNPRSKGWYKSLCHNSHSGDSLSNADAACVGALTATFAGISTVADICAVLLPSSPNNDSCGKAEDQLMTLALNICKERVCPSNAIDSACGNNGTVAQSLAQSDAIFANPSRTTATCNVAECLDKEINNGHALELDSLLSVRDGSSLRLNWLAPNVDDGQGQVHHYTIYRRAVGSKAPFVQIGTTTGLTFVDVNAGTGSWEYDLIPNY